MEFPLSPYNVFLHLASILSRKHHNFSTYPLPCTLKGLTITSCKEMPLLSYNLPNAYALLMSCGSYFLSWVDIGLSKLATFTITASVYSWSEWSCITHFSPLEPGILRNVQELLNTKQNNKIKTRMSSWWLNKISKIFNFHLKNN